ncbi:hypothetical protein HDV04_002334 [Boothiomyces sp. JEL0838]|nr:hypothetical protein HDV04_002528 [Boothiomyces sp. JEL0838]KAJ3313173.1 hypothetical protein HDV04_002334 [Boothiomyces sp. JEL0838]
MTNQPKKPYNSFFQYRKLKKHEVREKYNINKSHELNRKIGELWAKEPPHVKEYYQQLSLQEHEKFKKMYPAYNWQPWKSKQTIPIVKSARLSQKKNEQKPVKSRKAPLARLDLPSTLESTTPVNESPKSMSQSSPIPFEPRIRTPILFPKISEDVYEATKLDDAFGISCLESYPNKMNDEIGEFNQSPFLQYSATISPLSCLSNEHGF